MADIALAPQQAKSQIREATSWDQLKGKKVCLIQGSFYNKELQEKYGIEGVAFPGTAEAYSALRNGNCIAFAYDDTAILRLSFSALVVSCLVCLSHRTRRQDTRQWNMPFLKQHVRDIVGPVLTQFLVHRSTAGR